MVCKRKNLRCRVKIILLLILLCTNISVYSQKAAQPALIPTPQHLDWLNEQFVAEGRIYIVSDLDQNSLIINQIKDLFPEAAVRSSAAMPAKKAKNIYLKIENAQAYSTINKEYYKLTVNKGNITISSSSEAGIFRGVQTLRQLKGTANGKTYFAGCTISDWPAFGIRGFMQDVGRNYMSLPLLKEQIDVMAAYKYNVLHLHLTDNQGWRLESKQYPQLKDAATMSRWPGKYYTQKEFLELVDYCRDRFITLIPELDVPGHCEAFRKAFAFDSMSDTRVKPVLIDLVDELCALVPKEKMPYIHLGTDEVWHKHERPAPDLLTSLTEQVRKNGRQVIVWSPGQKIESDTTSITQLWSSNGHPKPGHRYLDSRLNYLNHLDPFAGMWQLYFDRICNAAKGDSLRMGGVLCCWNDNNLAEERDVLRMNPVYPGMLVYSETTWTGNQPDYGEKYLAVLPEPGSKAYLDFQNLEDRLCRHRDLYFKEKPFPYVKQSQIPWLLIGPFDHSGDMSKKFPVEDLIAEKYQVNGKTYSWWGPMYGGTIFPKHFFGYPAPVDEKQGTIYALTYVYSPVGQNVDCWIGFHGWSRSGGRRGGPFPQQGQWHTTQPKAWVNDKEIPPPTWKQPGLAVNTEEIPFTDEDYFYRPPAKIFLNQGWNKILLKVPQGGSSWKWMFTFVPIRENGRQVKEVEGLRYSVHPSNTN